MRNRFFVSLGSTLAILAWSDVGKSAFGGQPASPFDRNVWLPLLSLPVLWAARMFFTGALSALRQLTLDMNVLVAVAIGISWVYSLAVTLGLRGAVFYDAGAMLATFVLLGHWFEIRARGGASDSIRALLDLAPPKAVVIPDGEPVEVPTAALHKRGDAGMQHDDDLQTGRGTRSLLMPIVIVAVVVVFVVLHITGVVGAGSH